MQKIVSGIKEMRDNNIPKIKIILKRICIRLLIIAVIFSIGVYVGITKPWEKPPKETKILTNKQNEEKIINEHSTVTINTIQQILEPASDLITMKYNYTDADIFEDYKKIWNIKLPFTTDKAVFTYDGYVSVGIDLSKVKYEIDNNKKVINMTLPDLSIIGNEVYEESFEFPYKSNSIFNVTDMSNYVEVIGDLKKKKAEDVKNNKEFMKSAEENTKKVLKDFLTASELTKDYIVNFK